MIFKVTPPYLQISPLARGDLPGPPDHRSHHDQVDLALIDGLRQYCFNFILGGEEDYLPAVTGQIT